MNHQEAVRVVEAVRGVDGDCGICVDEVCTKLVKAFPYLNWHPILMETLVGEDLWDVSFVDGILEEAKE